jgi:hypothetical protein
MYRRWLAGFVITNCLLLVLTCGAGVWGIQRGLVLAPTGVARIGNFEVLAFTGVEFSTMRPPRGYYTIWVGIRKETRVEPRRWHPMSWAHRIVRLEVPPAGAQQIR